MFAPQPASGRFEHEFPLPLALRPSQIKAFSEDTSHMITAAEQLSPRYAALTCPTVIMAGDADRIVDIGRQAKRLHGAIPGSRSRRDCPRRRGRPKPTTMFGLKEWGQTRKPKSCRAPFGPFRRPTVNTYLLRHGRDGKLRPSGSGVA
jgi:hypothetical protein